MNHGAISREKEPLSVRLLAKEVYELPLFRGNGVIERKTNDCANFKGMKT